MLANILEAARTLMRRPFFSSYIRHCSRRHRAHAPDSACLEHVQAVRLAHQGTTCCV